MTLEEQFKKYLDKHRPHHASICILIKMVDERFEALESRLKALEVRSEVAEDTVSSLETHLMEIKKGDLLEYSEGLIVRVINERGVFDYFVGEILEEGRIPNQIVQANKRLFSKASLLKGKVKKIGSLL